MTKSGYSLNAATQLFLDKANEVGLSSLSEIGLNEFIKVRSRNKREVPQDEKLSVHRVENSSIPGPDGDIPVRTYWPRDIVDGEALAVTIYFHGGGFIAGDLELEDSQCRYLCKYAGLLVISVDYRLAPEHKFPAGLNDCYAVICWVADNAEKLGVDREKIIVAGGSAGGTLSIAVCLKAREENFPKISLQMPIYPGLASENEDIYPSRKKYGSGDLMVFAEDLEYMARLYVEDIKKDGKNPFAFPGYAQNFKDLPPAIVITAEFDPLRDEGKAYADRLRQDGVSVDYHCCSGTIHSFFPFDEVAHKKLALRLKERFERLAVN